MKPPMNLMQEIPVEDVNQRIKNDANAIALIGMISPPRLGVISFLTFLEHQHFTPKTERADLYESYTIDWEGAQFVVIVFPKSELHLAEPIMTKLGLRLRDGVPVSQCGCNKSVFPITAQNAYSLQYVPGHFAYRANEVEITKALEAERAALIREFRKIKASIK